MVFIVMKVDFFTLSQWKIIQNTAFYSTKKCFPVTCLSLTGKQFSMPTWGIENIFLVRLGHMVGKCFII